jgi:rhamnosyl/mannosyltransferase
VQQHSGTEPLRIFHAYKIYRPDIEGGIPAIISCLTKDNTASHSIVAARRFGWGQRYLIDNVPVEAVASLGNLFSTPAAPFYVPAFCLGARAADIVIHHAPFPLTDAAILLGLPANVTLIVYWHADILGFPLLKRMVAPLIRRVLARADRIVVSGQPMIDSSELLGPHAAKCVSMPYGIDLSYWRSLDTAESASVHEMRQKMPRHIAAVGRLVGYKGFDVLVRAMRDVDAQATIVGEGPLLGELQALAKKLDVADRIHFAGRVKRDDIKTILHSAQVLAFPSVTEAEAFGISQIEAMAAGLPIVNTQLPTTVPLVARHDQEGLTVPPNDPLALAQALNRILNEPALAARLGAEARKRANSEFNEEVFRARMTTVYREAMRAREKNAK